MFGLAKSIGAIPDAALPPHFRYSVPGCDVVPFEGVDQRNVYGGKTAMSLQDFQNRTPADERASEERIREWRESDAYRAFIARGADRAQAAEAARLAHIEEVEAPIRARVAAEVNADI